MFIILMLLSSSGYGAANCSEFSVSANNFDNQKSDSSFNTGAVIVGTISGDCDWDYILFLKRGGVALDYGQHFIAGKRHLSSGTNTIAYTLWQDPSANNEWGDIRSFPYHNYPHTYPAPYYLLGPQTGFNLPIYADASSIGVPPGLYTDIVNILVFSKVEITTRQLYLSLKVIGNCDIDVSGIGGNFGTYPTTANNIQGMALGSINVKCPPQYPYKVGMANGNNFDGTYRRMSDGGGHFVPYILRQTSSSGPEWGDTGLTTLDSTYVETHPAAAYSATGIGAWQTVYVWGDALLMSSGAPAGSYEDTVTITIVW